LYYSHFKAGERLAFAKFILTEIKKKICKYVFVSHNLILLKHLPIKAFIIGEKGNELMSKFISFIFRTTKVGIFFEKCNRLHFFSGKYFFYFSFTHIIKSCKRL